MRRSLETHLKMLKNADKVTSWSDARIVSPINWDETTKQNFTEANIVLVLVSPELLSSPFMRSDELKRMLERYESESVRIIPIIVRPVFWETSKLGHLDALPSNGRPITEWEDSDAAYKNIDEGLNKAINEVNKGLSSGSIRNFLVVKITLTNIRCFSEIEINLDINQKAIKWVVLLGDNAVGKSTLLRSIAIGLSDQSTATALINRLRGSFIRKGSDKGVIKIEVCHQDNQSEIHEITTIISKGKKGEPDRVKQSFAMPKRSGIKATRFDSSDIFICGYGAQRAHQATASFDEYQISNAVGTLFDEQNALQNPELFLLRRDQYSRRKIIDKILPILLLDEPGYGLELTDRGLEITGPWGKELLDSLSDGYRSTTQWILDLVSWLILAQKIQGDFDDPDLSGVILIDEIEQHLHPIWQRNIVQKLNNQFPGMQFITTTHTPLIAAGIVDVENSVLLKLEQQPDGSVTVRPIDQSVLRGRRADQILTSEAFDLVTTKNKGSEDDLDRLTELLGKFKRTAQEEEELAELRSSLKGSLQTGQTEVEREVETAVRAVLKERVNNINPELLDFETKKQLKELFRPRG